MYSLRILSPKLFFGCFGDALAYLHVLGSGFSEGENSHRTGGMAGVCKTVGVCEVLTSGRLCSVILIETSMRDYKWIYLSITIGRGAFQHCGPN